MNSVNSTMTKRPYDMCPLEICDTNEMQMKATFENYYLDHMSNLNIKSNPSKNTLTTLACGVRSNVTKDVIEELCERGVSMVLFDFNKLLYVQRRKMVLEIRQGVFNYSFRTNRVPYSLSLVLCLNGTSIMTGNILNKKGNLQEQMIELPTNGHVYVTHDPEYKDKCTADRIYTDTKQILRLKENDPIYLDDGKIELAVEKVETDEVYCLIKRGEFLGSQKTVHIPGIPIGVTALTEQDEEDVRIGIQLKVDVILVPGVRNAAYFTQVKNFVCQEKGKDINLYAKIDNSVGLENIDQIIQIADGIFLDRPNLSMEIGVDNIFLAQKIVLSKCNIIGKPIVTHGKFLNSMEFNTVPSSSEINDIITTVLDGTDCIYLEVTTRATHKAHCIEYASTVCRQGEAAIWEHQVFSDLNNKAKPKVDPAHAICIGCVEVSLKCHAAAIIVITTSGLSAKIVARYRPRCPVLAIIKNGKAARKITVWRNLTAVHYIEPTETIWAKDVENRTKFAMNLGKKRGILNQGDLVLHMSCSKQNAGFTNTMRLFYVGADDLIEDQ
ncbi:Pyruvate kinase,Pyruvate kinase-like, insert domain,Pyruvate/Phosphoenolpyruvate kinase-like [Cinara cedri]|uniref:Pyruvate kinase n=1 Tax=Cinara cedri TaxID=506608 RepID=A0A5E4NRB9_9HEMI|nr:Pyruvate kinase,Pyruvate kinase-like, insert domain,Pyruvate/Phosphoenolpyruvate kinase-like [Cinara cedri]